jgi:hypothetical protein
MRRVLERVVDMVRRLDPEDRCVALISGGAIGRERSGASASTVGKNLMSALRNELVSKEFNVSEITVDKLGNVGFHCNVKSGKVIAMLLDPRVPGAERQFRILVDVKEQAIVESDIGIHQIRDLVSKFWSTNSDRVEWVTWKEAEEHGRTSHGPGSA